MARGARYLTFEGQFERNVLGTFRIIRGFANLKDLAEISVPYRIGMTLALGLSAAIWSVAMKSRASHRRPIPGTTA